MKRRRHRRNPSSLEGWTPFLLGATGFVIVVYALKKYTR